MRALGLETGVAPGVVAAPAADPSLETLRRLLGLAQADAPSMVPAQVSAPQSVSPMQSSASYVARGPAQTTGAIAPQFVDPMQNGAGYVARGPVQTTGATLAPTMMDPDPAQIREIMHKVGLL
jgi:hypothetical protein